MYILHFPLLWKGQSVTVSHHETKWLINKRGTIIEKFLFLQVHHHTEQLLSSYVPVKFYTHVQPQAAVTVAEKNIISNQHVDGSQNGVTALQTKPRATNTVFLRSGRSRVGAECRLGGWSLLFCPQSCLGATLCFHFHFWLLEQQRKTGAWISPNRVTHTETGQWKNVGSLYKSKRQMNKRLIHGST